MEIASKVDFHTVDIFWNAFKTDFSKKTPCKSNFVEFVNFQKKCLNFIIFEKSKKAPWILVANNPYHMS